VRLWRGDPDQRVRIYGRNYFGGYDCNFYPADGTAWVASSTLNALTQSFSLKGPPS
jgi:hypothetical protein